MAITVTINHAKVVTIPDDAQAAASGQVVPSDWNAAHSASIAMASAALLGRTDPGTGPVQEITVGSNLTLSGGVLSASLTGSSSGTVTNVAVSAANGFTGSVADPTTSAVIVIGTSISTNVLKGNGTAILAATAGTDYLDPSALGPYSTSAALTAVYQPLDADLTSIAALTTVGGLFRTTANTWAHRTITGTSNEIDVADGDGRAGNPTLSIASAFKTTYQTVSAAAASLVPYSTSAALTAVYQPLDGDLTAIAALTGTGVPFRITLNSWGLTTMALGTVTSVTVSAQSASLGLAFTGNPITTAGTINLTGTLSVTHGGTGVNALATNAVAFLVSGTSASLAALLSDETGSGLSVFSVTPSISAMAHDVSSITAAGTTISTATAVSTDIVVAATVSSGTGIRLPANPTGRQVLVVNRGANNLSVYPDTADSIDSLTANVAVTMGVNAIRLFNGSSTSQWYSTFDLANAPGGSGTVTSVTVSAQSASMGLNFTGNPITTAGTINLTGVLSVTHGGTGVGALGTNAVAFLVSATSASLAAMLTDETGTGAAVFATGPSMSGIVHSVSASISAAGTTLTGGFGLAADYNVVTVATVTNNAITLPAAATGLELFVVNNDSADTVQVFPGSGDVINALSAGAAYKLAPAQRATFRGSSASQWWTDRGAGEWEYIAGASAVTASTVDFTGFDPDKYDQYQVVFWDVSHSDFSFLGIRTSTDGGSTYDSGASDYLSVGQSLSDVYRLWDSNTDSFGYLHNVYSFDVAETNFKSYGSITIYEPNQAVYSRISCDTTFYGNEASKQMRDFGSIWRQSAGDVNAIRLMPSFSTFSGEFRFYGRRK